MTIKLLNDWIRIYECAYDRRAADMEGAIKDHVRTFPTAFQRALEQRTRAVLDNVYGNQKEIRQRLDRIQRTLKTLASQPKPEAAHGNPQPA